MGIPTCTALCVMPRCTLIVLAERKEVGGAATYDNDFGVTLVTASNRRNPPQCLDSAIHHNNLLNNILVSSASPPLLPEPFAPLLLVSGNRFLLCPPCSVYES